MPARDPRVRAISSKLAAVERHHPERDHTELRRKLHEARYEERARELVATWPEHSPETCANVAALLRPLVESASASTQEAAA